MRKIEMLLWVLGIISIVMKLNLVTGASMLLLVSFVGLAIVYFPFKNSIRKTIVNKATPLETDKSEREQNRILISFSGIGLSAICVGVVFKFLNLPGGTVNLIVGIALLLITIIYLGSAE